MRASAHEIDRALALAEASLGQHEAAAARLDALIEQQPALGVVELNLGASYEARARIAIWAGQPTVVEQYASLAATQYRHGHGSPLGARYERLMDEARGAGIAMLPQLSAFESTAFGSTDFATRISAVTAIAAAMSGISDPQARAQRALQMLCEARRARGGYLFLTTASGLTLAAATTDAPPGAGMQEFARDFWTQQINDDDPDTEIPVHGASVTTHGTLIWTDLAGAIHQPLLISGVIDRVLTHAGVALLIPDAAGGRPSVSMQIVAELGVLLIRAGDTLGVRWSA